MVKYGVLFEVRTGFLNTVYKDDLRFQKVNGQIFLQKNSVNQLIFVMVKCGVLFEVRTECLNKRLFANRPRTQTKVLCRLFANDVYRQCLQVCKSLKASKGLKFNGDWMKLNFAGRSVLWEWRCIATFRGLFLRPSSVVWYRRYGGKFCFGLQVWLADVSLQVHTPLEYRKP
jgi:hypothetical protein